MFALVYNACFSLYKALAALAVLKNRAFYFQVRTRKFVNTWIVSALALDSIIFNAAWKG